MNPLFEFNDKIYSVKFGDCHIETMDEENALFLAKKVDGEVFAFYIDGSEMKITFNKRTPIQEKAKKDQLCNEVWLIANDLSDVFADFCKENDLQIDSPVVLQMFKNQFLQMSEDIKTAINTSFGLDEKD